MNTFFTPSSVEKNFFVDNFNASQRGHTFSLRDMYPAFAKQRAMKVHDANFAFLTTTLAKLHNVAYEPLYFVTYTKDIPIDVGGGFVDYVQFYTIDWSGIMNEFKNIVGNNANYVPRVNAGLNQKKVNVYTFEVAYDLRFIELEKMKSVQLQKSIQEIYQNAIVAGWDFFVQKVAYVGIQGQTGLFNDANVLTTTIDNSAATVANSGFKGMTDDAVASFFNGVFEKYLSLSGMNLRVLPDTFLVPMFVSKDLTSRFSTLYTSTLRQFILTHNLGVDESDGTAKVSILGRPDLDTLGTGSHGRIVAYKNDKMFVRLDMPYPIQHYITLPNIERMSYTSAFVGQVSQIQLPYNVNSTDLGVVTYWDFTK